MAQIKTKLIPIQQLNVPTAGTRVQANSGTSRQATTVIIQALTSNTGNIYVGDSTVASTLGLMLAPGASITLNADQDLENEDKTYIDVADIYIDAATNGNKANILVVDLVSINY
jgi:aryl-phospho-beta-D-glucosidase BglC (GH1 family)